MKFVSFEIKNYKGIDSIKLKLDPRTSITCLIGLNESGKSTILEAIANSHYVRTDLPQIFNYQNPKPDYASYIPKKKKYNFNEDIFIQFTLMLSDNDIMKIINMIEDKEIYEDIEVDPTLIIKNQYIYNDSKLVDTKFIWTLSIKGKERPKKRKQKRERIPFEYLKSLDVYKELADRIPPIFLFNNFLVDIPERIKLNESQDDDTKQKFYRNIVSDLFRKFDRTYNFETNILSQFNEESQQSKDIINNFIKKFNGFLKKEFEDHWNDLFPNNSNSKKSIEISLEKDKNSNNVYLIFQIDDEDGIYSISERSTGYRWFFAFLLLARNRELRAEKYENCLILLDEPAYNIHPTAQRKMKSLFKTLPNVIYTTHSHELIDMNNLENTYVVLNTKYTEAPKKENKNTEIIIYRYRDFIDKFPNEFSYIKPIYDLLDYKPNTFDLNKKIVVVEGKSDYYFFEYFRSKTNYDFSIIPGLSATKMLPITQLLLGWGTNFIILLDSDTAGNQQKKVLLDNIGVAIENKIVTYKDIDNQLDKIRVENLIDPTELETIYSTLFNSNLTKKSDFLYLFSNLTSTGVVAPFSKKSIDRVNQILQFLNDSLK